MSNGDYEIVIIGSGAGGGTLPGHLAPSGMSILYVVDASFFPGVGAVNPALTVTANALRVGDHLLALFR